MKDGNIGSFDGRDNRKALIDLFNRLGHGLDEYSAGMKRAMFLRSLLNQADATWQGKRLKVDPCSTTDAYMLLVALCSGFGVPMEVAAKKLEAAVRADDGKHLPFLLQGDDAEVLRQPARNVPAHL